MQKLVERATLAGVITANEPYQVWTVLNAPEYVVKTLTNDLKHKHKHHNVCFDNYFTSFQLLVDLEKEGIYRCGTARRNHREFLAALKNPGLKQR